MTKIFQSWKHAVAFLVIFSIIASVVISGLSAGFSRVSALSDVWDGTKAEAYAGGKGTESDPYLISNGAQLYKMVSENDTVAKGSGKFFKLTDDIYLNDVATTDIDKIVSPNVWYYTASGTSYIFAGTFDGNGHTIYGLYVNSGNRGGIFPQIGNATVRNLTVSKSYISTNGRPGAIAGAVWSGTSRISKCYIDSSVKIVGKDSAGGIVGYVNSAGLTVENCASIADVSVSQGLRFAGLVGHTANNVNCNVVLSTSWTLGYSFINLESSAKLTTKNCYNPSDAALITGAKAMETMDALDWVDTWKVTETFPVLKTVSENPFWDGTAAAKYDSGSGTANDPYIIADGAQLYKMVSENGINDGSAPLHFKLKNNIYLNDVSKSTWSTDGATPWYCASGTDYYFNDNLDGAGYSVFGLYAKTTTTRGGLFPQLSDGATVTNLTINNAVVGGTSGRSGAIAGTVQALGSKSEVKISNCAVINTTVTGGNAAGGLVGTVLSGCSVTNCCFIGTLTSTDNVNGGIAADCFNNDAFCKMTNCYSVGAYPMGNNFQKYTVKNVYTNIAKASKTGTANSNVTTLTEANMKGEAAKTNMTGFDFKTVWKTVENDYPTLYAPTDNIYWNGKAADSYAGGDGTEANPYLISDAAQLYKMVSENGTNDGSAQKYFKLTNDIYINDVKKENWKDSSPTPWYSVTGTTYYFNDILEGCGYTIYGLYNSPIGSRGGLFPQLSDGATIYNTNISDSAVVGSSGRSGAFAGTVQALGSNAEVKFTNCSVVNTSVEGGNAAAGFVGTFLANCSFSNCYFIGTLKSTDNVNGGITADGWSANAKIANCYSVGEYPASGNNEGSFTCTNVYTNIASGSKTKKSVKGITSFTDSDEAKMKGEAAKDNMSGFDFAKFWLVTESYPELVKRTGDGTVYDNGKPGDIWSGNVSKDFAGGTGTESDPYIIKTAGQLAKLVQLSVSGVTKGKHYKLEADIYLNDTSKSDWKETANQWFYTGNYRSSFKGHFDGNGHVVSGLYVNVKREGNTYTGLFPSLGTDAVVENVGVVNSEIILDGTIEMHAGSITGFIDIFDKDTTPKESYPRISQCFGDSNVYIEAKFPGGIVGSAGRPVIIENCFFTGDTYSYYGKYGAILGYTWMEYEGIEITDCYAAKQSLGTKISQDNKNKGKYTDCYSSGPQANEGITRVYISAMRGDKAKESMSLLDFDNIWVTRENQTPGLSIFNPKSYVTTNESDTVTVSFVTNCELKIPPISGRAYEHVDLPIPKRSGYKFDGWYAFAELDVPYSLDTLPSFDTSLYAKWVLTGIEQTFEDYPNTEYDLDTDYEWYRPITENYDATYVHQGAKSIHRLANGNDKGDFLLFYEDELEVGKTYTVSFWATTDQETASADLSILHSTWPDIHENVLGQEKVASMDLNKAEWKEFTFTFTAQSKWLTVRTTGDDSIYLDDFFIVCTDDSTDTGVYGDIPNMGDKNGIAVGVFVMALLTMGIFSIRKVKN